MKNVSAQSCTENRSTHFMFSNFFPDNPAIYEIMWKKIWYSRTGHRWHNPAHALCMLG